MLLTKTLSKMGLNKKLETLNIPELNNTKNNKNKFKIKKCTSKSIFGNNKYEDKLFKAKYNNPFIHIHKVERSKSLVSLNENTLNYKINTTYKKIFVYKEKINDLKNKINEVKLLKNKISNQNNKKKFLNIFSESIDFYRSMIKKFKEFEIDNYYLNELINKKKLVNDELKRKIEELTLKLNEVEKESGVKKNN